MGVTRHSSTSIEIQSCGTTMTSFKKRCNVNDALLVVLATLLLSLPRCSVSFQVLPNKRIMLRDQGHAERVRTASIFTTKMVPQSEGLLLELEEDIPMIERAEKRGEGGRPPRRSRPAGRRR